jgi:hypothetical protein
MLPEMKWNEEARWNLSKRAAHASGITRTKKEEKKVAKNRV